MKKLIIPVAIEVIVQELDWRLVARGGDSWFVPDVSLDGFYAVIDAEDARNEFLKIKTPEEALAFFRRFHCAWRDKHGSFTSISFSDLREVQAMTKRLMALRLSSNMYTEPLGFQRHLHLQIREGSGFFLFPHKEPVRLEMQLNGSDRLISAFGSLIAVEKAAGVCHRVCAATGCSNIVDSDNPRTRYCRYGCGPRLAQRAYIKRRKEKKSSVEIKKKDGKREYRKLVP